MAKYKRSIQGGGFRPEQVSGQGEARLQEYADRIAGALREERDAVISNRNRTADAMKENAQIQSSQLERDQRIQQQNLQTQVDQAQQMSRRAMEEFETKTAATKQMFGTIAKFSDQAAVKLQEIELERVHKQWDQDFANTLLLGDNAPGVKETAALIKENEAATVKAQADLNDAKNNGADEVQVSELGKRIRSLSYGAKLATLQLIGEKYGTYLKEQLMDETLEYKDGQGNVFKGSQAGRNRERASIVASKSLNRFLEMNGIKGMNPALLQKSGFLNTVLAENQQVMRVAGKAQIEDNNATANMEFKHGWQNARDAAAAKEHIEKSWPDLVARLGVVGAFDFLTQEAKKVDLDGNPVNLVEGLMSAVLVIDGQPPITFGERKARAAEIMSALRDAKSSSFRAEERVKQETAIEAYRAKRDSLMAEFEARGASGDADHAATVKRTFWEKYGYYPPEMLEDFKNIELENKQEAEAKLANLKILARDGLLTQGKVLSIGDPTLRAEAQALLNEQNKTSRFGVDYQKTIKSLSQDAKKIFGDSLEGSSSSQATELGLFMEKQFAEWYKEGLTIYNQDPARALDHANKLHRSEMAKSLAGDATGLYVTETGAYNSSTLPNVEKTRKRTQAATDNNIKNIQDAIGATGINALNSPYLLGKANDLRRLSQTHYTGGEVGSLITPEIKKAAQLLKISPIEAINKQIEAHNKYNPTDRIEPITSQLMDAVNNADPKTQSLLMDLPTPGSVNRAAAVMQQTPLTDPGNIRASIVQYVTGQPSMAGVVRGADGRAVVYDPDGHGGKNYHNHYQLNSVQERERIERILSTTIDPWTKQPYRITSTIYNSDGSRRGGTHGMGLSIDIAPPLSLPPDQEEAWSAHLNKVLGYDPLRAN